MPAGSLRRDIVSAYVLAACRVLAWVVIAAVVYRTCRPRYFAALALVRATVGLLGYTSMGIGPAMVRAITLISPASRPGDARRAEAVTDGSKAVLNYASTLPDADPLAVTFSTGFMLSGMLAIGGSLLAVVYGLGVDVVHAIGDGTSTYADGKMLREFQVLAWTMGGAMVLRLAAEPYSALLQARGRIGLDNFVSTAGEVVWAALSVLLLLVVYHGQETVKPVGIAFMAAMGLVWLLKMGAARFVPGYTPPRVSLANGRTAGRLLGFGALVVLAQAADFLYAPTGYILINRLLDPVAVAAYAPAVQVDAGLLLLVAGLAAVMFPLTAIAHAAGDRATVRAYYIRGTLASLGLLVAAALVVWALSPWLFKLWLGDPLPATQAILPLVLVHTVVGGSGAVGRSVLLGMGKVGPFTAAVLVSGVANVVLSYCFVKFGGLGLNGIVLGTILAVAGRAGVWMPWYTLRAIRRMEGPLRPEPGESAVAPV